MEQHSPTDDDLLDIPGLHAQYGAPVRTLQRLVWAERALPVVKLGRRVFVRRGDWLAYVAAHTAPAVQAGTR